MTVTYHNVTVETIPDYDPDTSYLKQEGWEDRLDAYQRGEFDFVAVRAKCEIHIPHGNVSIIQAVSSPGLWGIEDDGDDYLEEVGRVETAILMDMLRELGAVEGES